jgi:hypothetical protein
VSLADPAAASVALPPKAVAAAEDEVEDEPAVAQYVDALAGRACQTLLKPYFDMCFAVFQGTSDGGRQFLSKRRSNRRIVPLYGTSDRLFTHVFRCEEHRPPFEVPWKTAKTVTTLVFFSNALCDVLNSFSAGPCAPRTS